MTNEECLNKALEYTGITNNCCNKVDRCIFTNHCYCFGEISECEEYTVFKRIKNALEKESVRHGKYIGTEFDGYADGCPVYYEWKCSECGCVFEEEEPTYNYCPNCGAKMNKERKEE